jgi:hypothetical protein
MAALAMLMVASVPVLAQFLTVDCSDLYPGIMPMKCVVNEDDLTILPDGTKAPYTVTGNPVTAQEGDLDPAPEVVDSEPVVIGREQLGLPVPEVPEDRAGSLQYGSEIAS